MTYSLVLDTNVVLDWLVFKDPSTNMLWPAVQDGRIALVTYPPALDELQHVLKYPQFKLDAGQQKEILALYLAHASNATLPAEFSLRHLLLPAGFPVCRDRDDQHFLALAYHVKVDALVSKDNAVLSLSKRAEKFGLTILTVKQLNILTL